MSFCKKCGTELKPGARFCTKCGTPVAAAMNPAGTDPAEPKISVPVTPEDADTDKTEILQQPIQPPQSVQLQGAQPQQPAPSPQQGAQPQGAQQPVQPQDTQPQPYGTQPQQQNTPQQSYAQPPYAQQQQTYTQQPQQRPSYARTPPNQTKKPPRQPRDPKQSGGSGKWVVLIIILLVIAALVGVGLVYREEIIDKIAGLTGRSSYTAMTNDGEDQEEPEYFDEDKEETGVEEEAEAPGETEAWAEPESETETELVEEPEPAILADMSADGVVSYLAVGNVITAWTPVENLWWGTWGAAATRADYDYVHRTAEGLSRIYPDALIKTDALNFYDWETAADRSSVLGQLDAHLNEELDLVTIQLGECVDEGVNGCA